MVSRRSRAAAARANLVDVDLFFIKLFKVRRRLISKLSFLIRPQSAAGTLCLDFRNRALRHPALERAARMVWSSTSAAGSLATRTER